MSASPVAGECLTCGGPRELQCKPPESGDVAAVWIRCLRNDDPSKACGNADRQRIICPRCEPNKREPLFRSVR